MILRNREGFREYDIRPDWLAGRVPGLSGLLRLRDEETWCALAIESFLPWLDELVIVVQPSTDGTREIVERYAGGKVRIYDYPYQSHPRGPGHDNCPADSVYASAWYYNWTLAQSTRTHVVKLDGDMVMMDWAGAAIREMVAAGLDRIRFHGVDIVGDELAHTGCHVHCPTDGVYPVTPGVHYRQGSLSQCLDEVATDAAIIDPPAFLHFKWARKPIGSVTKAWPADWHTKEHFTRIWQRRIPIDRYRGEYPASILRLLADEAA